MTRLTTVQSDAVADRAEVGGSGRAIAAVALCDGVLMMMLMMLRVIVRDMGERTTRWVGLGRDESALELGVKLQ